MDKTNVFVLFGGKSQEHEVSCASAKSIIDNINREKYNIKLFGITKEGRWIPYKGPVEALSSGEWTRFAEELPEKATKNELQGNIGNILGLEKINSSENTVIFPVLHGPNGEDGTIQGMLQLMDVPYVGCGVLSSSLSMDKAYTKIIVQKEGIPQLDYLVFPRYEVEQDIDTVMDKIEGTLSYPCFIKPSNAGSSVGISKAKDRISLKEALNTARLYDIRIIAEAFADGRELECAVLGNREPECSLVGEVIPCHEFYDYEAKYMTGDDSKIIIPAQVDRETCEKVRKYSAQIFKALDCSGLSRVDFFLCKKTGRVYFNEINTMPGFTNISMYSKLWAASGMPYPKLVERLIELAVEKHRDSWRVY